MLQKVSTDAGECWAIVFPKTNTMEDIVGIQSGIIDLVTTATQSSPENTPSISYYYVLSLLKEMIFNDEQAVEYERLLK